MLFSVVIKISEVLSSGICSVVGLSHENAVATMAGVIRSAINSGAKNIEFFFGSVEPDAILDTSRQLVWSKLGVQKTMIEAVRLANAEFFIIMPSGPMDWLIAFSPMALAIVLAYFLSPSKEDPKAFNYGKLVLAFTVFLYACWIGLAIYKWKYDVFVKIQIPEPRI